jgi:TRAP-type uncharacterized transport system substrate-binding protein
MNIHRAIEFIYPGVKYLFNGIADIDHIILPEGYVVPTSDQLTAADLAAAIAQRISKAKGEAATRIYTQYPPYVQSNVALGLYDSLSPTDPFFPANVTAGIQTIITAEHNAEVAINALTDSASVDTFTW